MSSENAVWLTVFVSMGGLVALFLLPAVFRSRDILFAVTVNPEFPASPDGRAIVRWYQRLVLVQGLIWMGLLAVAVSSSPRFLSDGMLGVAITVAQLGLVLGAIAAFSMARNRVMPFRQSPSGVREAALFSARTRIVTRPMVLLMISPFALILVATLFLCARWGDLPSQIPTHWNLRGEVDAVSHSPFKAVVGPLALAGIFNFFMIGAGLMIVRQARRLFAVGRPAELECRAQRCLLAILVMAAYFITSLFVGVACIPLMIRTSIQPGAAARGAATPAALIYLAIGGSVLVVGASVFLSLRVARLMNEAKRIAAAEGNLPVGDRTDDRFWKWGLFYYNPDDPAVWVAKRLGLGWTCNFARWQSYAWIVLLLGLPLMLSAVTIWMTK